MESQPERYDARWCTLGEQNPSGSCADRQYEHTPGQYLLVDNDGDHEITFGMGGTGTPLLVGIIPQSSDIAAITISVSAYKDLRTRAWEATWNESLSRQEAAIRQGESVLDST